MEVRYELSRQDQERLDQWHYHGEVPDTQRFVDINDKTRELARFLMRRCPPGRHLSLALTALEDVRMRANAAIAVTEGRAAPNGVETRIEEKWLGIERKKSI